MPDQQVDFGAVARVARRVSLREIRLAEVTASAVPSAVGRLEPDISHECIPTKSEPGVIEVECSYRFIAKAAEAQIAEANLKYMISYDLEGEEALSDADVKQFAFANGTYHSWPFVRQMIFDLTSRMGYQPYSLPVFKFNPKPPPPKPTAPPEAASTATPDAAPDKGSSS